MVWRADDRSVARLALSTDFVHESETRVGHTPVGVNVGAVGGVVSGGVL